MRQIHMMVFSAAVVVAILVAVLFYRFYCIGKRLQEEMFGQRVYKTVEDSFREGRVPEYQKLQRWLKAIGADFAVKGFGDPFYFLAVNGLIVLVVLVVFGVVASLLEGVVMAVVIVVTELLMLVLIDQRNNRDMLDDVSFLYDATAIQLASNIYMAQAISNCVEHIRNKRLKQALTELCSNITLGGDVRIATKDFSEKFQNEYLDTFCNVIVQITAETGEAGRLIEDMAKQLSVLKETYFASRKKSTENRLQLCIIGIFIVFTVLIFYLCIASMTGSADMLF